MNICLLHTNGSEKCRRTVGLSVLPRRKEVLRLAGRDQTADAAEALVEQTAEAALRLGLGVATAAAAEVTVGERAPSTTAGHFTEMSA